jgi:hypothetical protein
MEPLDARFLSAYGIGRVLSSETRGGRTALPAAEDAEYATLIPGRVRMIRLIRAHATPDLLWEPSL